MADYNNTYKRSSTDWDRSSSHC